MSKIVVAYYTNEISFKVPKGLDLCDETQVIGWGIDGDNLSISLADGTNLEIPPSDNCTEYVTSQIRDMEEEEESEEEDGLDYDAVVTGIICKKCGITASHRA